MKKYLPLAIIALLLFASIASAQRRRALKGASAGKTSIEATLAAVEKDLWEAWKNKKPAAFEKYISADAILVSDEGTAGKDQVVKEIPGNPCEIRDYSLSDFKVTMIDSTSAILTFKATQDYTCDGKAGPTPIYASSVYVKRGGQWLNIFHQETPAKKD